jgi:hypothetical protein
VASLPSSGGPHARSGWAHIVAVFAGLLVVELIADIVLFPADVVLVPAEGILDTIVGVVMILGAVTGRGGGRQIRSRTSAYVVALGVVLMVLLQGSAILGVPPPQTAHPVEIPSDLFTHPPGAFPSAAAPHPATSPAATDPSWANLCSGSSPFSCSPQPAARSGPAVAWDGADHYVLVAGGGTSVNGGVQNDSWSWTAGAWHEFASAPTTMVARSNASLVYDVVDGYMLMFGGYTGSGAYSAQTWKFLAGAWTLLSPSSAPQASAPACMVYVPFVSGHGGYVLLFGGKGKPGSGTSAYYGYTWEFSAGSWTNVTASVGTAPSARGYSQCTYDSADGYVLLFGGMSTTSTTPLGDTWEFNPQASASGAWVSLSPAKSPEARFQGNMVYSTALAGTYLMCGAVGTLAAKTDQGAGYGCTVWQWSSGNWANVTSTFGFGTGGGAPYPKPSYGAGMADVPIYSYAFRFGGYTTQTTNGSNAFGNILAVTFGASNGETFVGGSVTLYANGTYGVGPYTYSWTGLPSGCTAGNSSAIVCFPSVRGTYASIGAEVFGSDGFNISQTGITLVVDPVSTVLGNLTLGNYVDSPGQPFWGVDLSSNQLNTSDMSSIAALVNETPFRTIRYGTNGDGQNASNLSLGPLGVSYAANGAASESNVNYTMFKTFCSWVRCTPIVTIPIEANDRGLAALTVKQIETVDHFFPIYNLGNEPTGWNHFNIAYKNWKSTDNVEPTSAQFVLDAENATTAILSVDPNAKIIGLTDGSGTVANPPFGASTFQALAAGDGSYLVGMDFHAYPSSGESLKTPSAALSHANDVQIAGSYASYKAGMVAGCSACNLSLSVGEFNTGANGNPYPETYVSGVGAAANGAQLLALGSSMFSYFDLLGTSGLDLVNASNLSPFPAFGVYTGVLAHLPMAQIYNATVTTTMRNVWAVEGVNGTRSGILVVNANTSVGLTMTSSAQFGSDGVTIYQDSPAGLLGGQFYATPPKGVYVPAEGVVLLVYAPLHSAVPPATIANPAASGGLSILNSGVFLGVAAVATVLLLMVLVFTVFSHPRGRSGRRVGR